MMAMVVAVVVVVTVVVVEVHGVGSVAASDSLGGTAEGLRLDVFGARLLFGPRLRLFGEEAERTSLRRRWWPY